MLQSMGLQLVQAAGIYVTRLAVVMTPPWHTAYNSFLSTTGPSAFTGIFALPFPARCCFDIVVDMIEPIVSPINATITPQTAPQILTLTLPYGALGKPRIHSACHGIHPLG